MIKNKERALQLVSEVKNYKQKATKEIIDKMTEAQNLCPHSYKRNKDLDAEGVETYECKDCGNLDYVQMEIS
jgi:hypothetical protein